tara:strand:+ start:171 stop:410 length:240 start_codon:yes stop_codon:yes gene_type:complete
MAKLDELLMITDYSEMTREELEVLTDELRVERNSLVLEVEALKEVLEEMNSPKLGETKYSESGDEQGDLEEPLGGPVLG